MAKSESQILAKLDRPPAAHNWAMCNHPTLARTTTSMLNLAMGFPTISYQWAQTTIQIMLADGRARDDSLKMLRTICPPNQLDHNLSLLLAFLEYNEERQFQGIRIFDEFSGNFLAGPDVKVPVKPTAILRENGVLKPLFVIGWAHNRLSYFQRRLLTTLYEDAIFSLTDFRSSPGEVLIFPEDGYGIRRTERWERNTYQQLAQSELAEQVQRFIEARDSARLLVPQRLKEQQARKAAHSRTSGTRPPSPDAPPPGKGR
jgi:hypothetical protein